MRKLFTLFLLLSFAAFGARSTNGTNQCLNTGNLNLTGTSAITVAFWMWKDAFADDDQIAFEISTNFVNTTLGFVVDPDASSPAGKFSVQVKGDVGFNSADFTRPSAAAWHHYAFVIDKGAVAANEIIPYVDGVAISFTKSQSSNNTNAFGNLPVYVGSRGCSSLWTAGRFAEVQIYNQTLTANQVASIYHTGALGKLGLVLYLPLWGNASPEPDLSGSGLNATVTGAALVNHCPCGRVIPGRRSSAAQWPQWRERYDGDSITAGQGLSDPSQWFTAVATAGTISGTSGGLNVNYVNYGINGQTVATMLSNVASKIVGTGASPHFGKDVVVMMGGINDLAAGDSAGTVEGNIVAYGQAVRAGGYKFVANTILPCQSTACNAVGDLETKRQAINAYILANCATFADACVDGGGDPTIGPFAAALNATYYQSDHVHPTAAGDAILGALVSAKILSL